LGRLKYLFILFISQVIFSQKQPEISSFIENILELRFKENLEIAQRLDNKYFLLLTKIIEDDRQSNLKDLDTNFINLKNRNEKLYDEYLYHLIKGYEYLNYNKNRIESYNSYENSYLIAKKKEDKSLIKLSLFAILNFYLKGLLQNDGDFKVYLKEYKSLCISPTDWLYYYSFKFNLISQTEIYDEKKSLYDIKHNKIFKSYDSLIDNSKIIKPLFYYYKDKANFIIRQNPTLAKAYYLKSKSLHTESNFYKFHNFNSLINLSRISSLTKNYKEGIKFLYKAQNYISVNDSLLDIFDISIHKANHYFNLKRFDSAFFYENKSRNLGYLVNFQKHNTEVSKIKIELETERKGKENLQLKQDNLEIESKRKQNRDLLIGSFLFIFLGGIIITLAFKSSKRKRKVAQKEAELEIQKNLTLLKEKEITTINAMIDGQEKERKRIA
jgi:two-component system sensor histidine kinase DegS